METKVDLGSLREEILRRTKDGLDIVDAMIEIASPNGGAKAAERMKALEWLAQYSFGKPVERQEVEVSISHLIKEGRERVRQLTRDEVAILTPAVEDLQLPNDRNK